MKNYVVGFLFKETANSLFDLEVCLINKTHPEWQRGLENGPGGSVNENEVPSEAMSREFQEETGVLIAPLDWNYLITLSYGTLDLNPVQVHVFAAKAIGWERDIKTMTEEEVQWIPLRDI